MKKRDLPVCPIPADAQTGDTMVLRSGKRIPFLCFGMLGLPIGGSTEFHHPDRLTFRKDGAAFYDIAENDCIKFIRKSPAPAKREVKAKVARVWKRWAIVTTDGRAVCTYYNRQTARNSLRHFDGKVIRVEIREVRK